jgi:glycosyltransferase involved in cell wall biosynthesis
VSHSSASGQRLAIQFSRFGPYHLARLSSAAAHLATHHWQVIGLETAALDHTYAWRQETDHTSFERHTVFPEAAAESLPAALLNRGMQAALDQLRPHAVAIAGWATADARACLAWCRRHHARAILMSDTRSADGRRLWWKEAIKRRLLRRYDAALVAGRSQRDYLITLGFPAERIAFRFDVVDNATFRTASVHSRQQNSPVRPYLLASNRFIPRKNLRALLRAFAAYCQRLEASPLPLWDLCLLGDGPERDLLLQDAADLGLWIHPGAPWDVQRPLPITPGVLLPGFRQIDELPRFYAHAAAFIHPASSEPWGLVINEAMASGLPILSSRNVGAAEELLDHGLNGFAFDPGSVASISEAILALASLPPVRLRAMGAASERLLQQRCPTSAFADGLLQLLDLPPRAA